MVNSSSILYLQAFMTELYHGKISEKNKLFNYNILTIFIYFPRIPNFLLLDTPVVFAQKSGQTFW